jgi:hypothetical protein
MQTYDAVFFVSVGTLVIGFFGLVIKYCLKSKCENVKLCYGLIEIKRRVDLETEVEMHEIDASATDLPSPDLETGVPPSEVKPRQRPRHSKVPALNPKSIASPMNRDLLMKSPSHQEVAYQEVPADPPSRSE